MAMQTIWERAHEHSVKQKTGSFKHSSDAGESPPSKSPSPVYPPIANMGDMVDRGIGQEIQSNDSFVIDDENAYTVEHAHTVEHGILYEGIAASHSADNAYNTDGTATGYNTGSFVSNDMQQGSAVSNHNHQILHYTESIVEGLNRKQKTRSNKERGGRKVGNRDDLLRLPQYTDDADEIRLNTHRTNTSSVRTENISRYANIGYIGYYTTTLLHYYTTTLLHYYTSTHYRRHVRRANRNKEHGVVSRGPGSRHIGNTKDRWDIEDRGGRGSRQQSSHLKDTGDTYRDTSTGEGRRKTSDGNGRGKLDRRLIGRVTPSSKERRERERSDKESRRREKRSERDSRRTTERESRVEIDYSLSHMLVVDSHALLPAINFFASVDDVGYSSSTELNRETMAGRGIGGGIEGGIGGKATVDHVRGPGHMPRWRQGARSDTGGREVSVPRVAYPLFVSEGEGEDRGTLNHSLNIGDEESLRKERRSEKSKEKWGEKVARKAKLAARLQNRSNSKRNLLSESEAEAETASPLKVLSSTDEARKAKLAARLQDRSNSKRNLL